MKEEYTHLEIKQTFEFQGCTILIESTNWISQKNRTPHVNLKVYSHDTAKNDTEVTGPAAKFIISEFKKTDLYIKNIISIFDYKVNE